MQWEAYSSSEDDEGAIVTLKTFKKTQNYTSGMIKQSSTHAMLIDFKFSKYTIQNRERLLLLIFVMQLRNMSTLGIMEEKRY